MDWKDKLKGLKEVLPEGEVPEIKEETVLEKKGPKIELRVELDKRNGKPATLVTGLDNDEEADSLAKKLKKACSSGGSSRDGEILVQGDFRVKIAAILEQSGYRVKKINFK